MPWINQTEPTKWERIVAGFCYLTFGLIGLLYIIVSGRSGQSSFFRFHFLQSIILGIIGLILSWCSGIFVTLLSAILGMVDSLAPGLGTQSAYWISQAVLIIVRAAYLLLIYGMIWAFLGKYAEIPYISNLVRQQMR